MAIADIQGGAAALAEHFTYLDELRESGITNMWGAAAYLVAERDLENKEAKAVLKVWMQTFSDAPAAERAAKALEAGDVD